MGHAGALRGSLAVLTVALALGSAAPAWAAGWILWQNVTAWGCMGGGGNCYGTTTGDAVATEGFDTKRECLTAARAAVRATEAPQRGNLSAPYTYETVVAECWPAGHNPPTVGRAR